MNSDRITNIESSADCLEAQGGSDKDSRGSYDSRDHVSNGCGDVNVLSALLDCVLAGDSSGGVSN